MRKRIDIEGWGLVLQYRLSGNPAFVSKKIWIQYIYTKLFQTSETGPTPARFTKRSKVYLVSVAALCDCVKPTFLMASFNKPRVETLLPSVLHCLILEK